jgi:hypothetical protein
MALRLLVFDRTCTWLSRAWGTGAHLYRGLRRIDAARPVSSWVAALFVPGARPTWSASEGVWEGTPAQPIRAHGSSFSRPRTVTCFTGSFSDSWFDEDSGARHDGC